MPSLLKATEELIETRRGGGNVTTGDSWEDRKYAVYFVDYTATSIDARNATGVPAWGAALGIYNLYCLEKSAEHDPNDPTIWYVTVTYRTLTPTDKIPSPNSTVHKWQIIKSIVPQPVEIPIQYDADFKMAANCLGEPFDPPITEAVYDQRVNVSFLTDAADQTNIEGCLGCVNSATVVFKIGGTTWTFPAGELKFQDAPIQEDIDVDGSLTLAKVDYQFVWRSGGWEENRPNLSFNQSISGFGIVPIMDDTKTQPVTTPRYLDAAGVPIPAGGTITLNYLQPNYTANFAGLLSEIT